MNSECGSFLVGFHLEGSDFRIIKCLLARIVGIDESKIEEDVLLARSGGSSDLIKTIPDALARFYGKGAVAAVVGMDNDGERDLLSTSESEDPHRPRHWLHGASGVADCRYCKIASACAQQARRLTYRHDTLTPWPVVVAVPVEAIESWILVARAVARRPDGEYHAERMQKSNLKHRVYGAPFVIKDRLDGDVIPLLQSRELDLSAVCRYSSSFHLFYDHVSAIRNAFV